MNLLCKAIPSKVNQINDQVTPEDIKLLAATNGIHQQTILFAHTAEIVHLVEDLPRLVFSISRSSCFVMLMRLLFTLLIYWHGIIIIH